VSDETQDVQDNTESTTPMIPKPRFDEVLRENRELKQQVLAAEQDDNRALGAALQEVGYTQQ
jgi:hypothetical protein